MSYMDEKIAMRLKRERMKQQSIEKLKEKKALEESLDMEQLKKDILEGHCSIFDHEFDMEAHEVCDGRFVIMLPKKGLQITNDRVNVFTANSEDLSYSCSIVATNDPNEELDSLSKYKSDINNGFKQYRFKWVEEGSCMVSDVKLEYLDYIMLTGIMKLHNQMWFLKDQFGVAKIIINYEEENDLQWKPLLRGIRETFEIIRKR